MATIRNPILPGFHPDPSICRAGDHYYLATSTFEWWPGVRIHRSPDLANWTLVGGALNRRSQLDLRGVPDSGGVWAPDLSFADGRFWLVFTDAKSLQGPFKDLRNYLVTAERIEGPWSEPILLNASGFDPSLFHDDDGRKWLLCQRWRVRPGLDAFSGITLQEYLPQERKRVGEPRLIFSGTNLRITEGPHLYRKDGYYYLVTAEGGTGWTHAVTVARSRTLEGPYEVCPYNPILTSRDAPQNPLQKAGHASLIEGPDGRWFMVHLCSRPSPTRRHCILGRETALQALEWPRDEWPRLVGEGNHPALEVEVPYAATAGAYVSRFADDFFQPTLDPQWSTLREPVNEPWLSLTERRGVLRLRGRYSLQSAFDQSAVGFRLLHPRCRVRVSLDFVPRTFQQQAGLALFYNSSNFYYAYLTANEEGVREIRILACDNRTFRDVLPEPLPALGGEPVELSAQVTDEALQFFVRLDREQIPLGPELDATILSDEYPTEGGIGWAFTGAFAVLCAQDASDMAPPADFAQFRYEAIEG